MVWPSIASKNPKYANSAKMSKRPSLRDPCLASSGRRRHRNFWRRNGSAFTDYATLVQHCPRSERRAPIRELLASIPSNLRDWSTSSGDGAARRTLPRSSQHCSPTMPMSRSTGARAVSAPIMVNMTPPLASRAFCWSIEETVNRRRALTVLELVHSHNIRQQMLEHRRKD